MSPEQLSLDHPLVVVGSGPAGHRLIQAVCQRAPSTPIVWFGDEPWAPYNRVKLSSLLAGEASWDDITEATPIPDAVETRFGLRIERIDRAESQVIDVQGQRQRYGALVLATGSRAHVPSIPGVQTPGVFTFRHLNDAQKLQARSVRSRTTVVIGGGLLGLEAARAVRRYNTHVIVVEHADRLMSRQLDGEGAQWLLKEVLAAGIEVRLSAGVKGIEGTGEVKGVLLRSGEVIACDTVIIATGIVPNNELALRAGLQVGRGIKIDDATRTSDEHIYAVGECAEHNGEVYGLVAPGLEQAAVAANRICGGEAVYTGSVLATNLKVLGCKVFSLGEVERGSAADPVREYSFADPDGDGYRRIMVRNGQLVGAQAVGPWPETPRVQEAVRQGRRLYPWQTLRFMRIGQLWPDTDASDVNLWPADATVCNCTGVTRGQLDVACQQGCKSVEALSQATGAGTVCGSCKPLLVDLAGGGPLPPERGWKPLTVFGGVALLAALFYLLLKIPFPDTADLAWRWDVIWRESLYKQISGYSALGVMVLLAIIGLRKRWPTLSNLFQFSGWRVVHVMLGALLVAVMLVHTGGRLGANLDMVMTLMSVVAVLSGAALALIVGRQQALAPGFVKRTQRGAVWIHILALWGLPALLGLHILKAYYF
ncbi:FAD-dependent oxidoreductase [Nitrogeniibacter aestuarii]|uniref:FAD-dependent oxidoreductase n=1 Tax=Nitrogeniibacter aestuarii TaxID=2815343 RepID=UPI001E4027CE|nr:FAD-dependent oxidoreductase [Nitrogeniibacter aestuarii]